MTTASVIAPAERAALTAGAGRHGKLYWALADAWVLCWRNIVQLPRMPELLVFSIIQPVMFVLLFRFVFGNAIQVPGGNYVNFLMAGIFVQTVAFGSVGTGIGLAEDLHRGSSTGSAPCRWPARLSSSAAPCQTSSATASAWPPC